MVLQLYGTYDGGRLDWIVVSSEIVALSEVSI